MFERNSLIFVTKNPEYRPFYLGQLKAVTFLIGFSELFNCP
jgi:hypothetical protein